MTPGKKRQEAAVFLLGASDLGVMATWGSINLPDFLISLAPLKGYASYQMADGNSSYPTRINRFAAFTLRGA